MRRLLIIIAAACIAVCGMAQVNNANSTGKVNISITASWSKIYAWMWKGPKQYNERFIPLTKADDGTWILTLDMDEMAYKKAGILFVNTDTWNTDLQKTSDIRLSSGCYLIPKAQKQGQLVKRPNGLVCKELIYDCKKMKCK